MKVASFICSLLFLFPNAFAETPLLDLSLLPMDLRLEVEKQFTELNQVSPKAETNNLAEFDRLLRFVMAKGIFESAEIIKSDGHYRLKVRNLRLVGNVRFSGSYSLPEDLLKSTVQVSTGDQFDIGLLTSISSELTKLFTAKGYPNSEVAVTMVPESPTVIGLLVTINQGIPLRVKKINIQSGNQELNAKISRMANKRQGKVFTEDLAADLLNDINGYIRRNRYFRAEAMGPVVKQEQPNDIELNFLIQNTEKYRIEFEGNYHIPSTQLEYALELNEFYSTATFLGQEFAKRITHHYQKRGYARVEVEVVEESTQPSQSGIIRLKINEGHRIKVKDIVFTGQLSRSPKQYRSFLEDNGAELLDRGYLYRDEIEGALQLLVSDIIDSGRLKARILSTRYQYNEKKDGVTITINLDEGPQTNIKAINISGTSDQIESDLRSEIPMKIGTPLRLSQIDLSTEIIRNHLRDLGFLEASILNEKGDLITYSEDLTEGTLNFKILEGPKVKVQNIQIEGNTITKDYVIRKELEFKENEVLTPQKISESIKRLQKLGLFSVVEIRMLEEKTPISDRTVVVKVIDRNPGLFNVGVGVTNERELTIRGFTGLAYRNIGGSARAISGRIELNNNIADIKYTEFKATAGYLEPYIFGSRAKGKVFLTRSTEVTDYDKKQATDTSQLDLQIEQNITSNLLLSYDLWNLSTARDFDINKSSTRPDKVQNIATTGPGLELDYRDHPFNPSKGSVTRIQLEYSNPNIGSSRTIEFSRITAGFSLYTPLKTSRWVLANSVRGGYLKNLSSKADGGIPYDKKGFVLGGLTTIRGFEAGTKERFPNDDDLGGDDFVLSTESHFFLLKSELRFPLIGEFDGAVFYDGGLVNVKGIKFSDPYRDALGFGLRYGTPVGPLNFDLAWKLDRKVDRRESQFRFHFSIGTF